MPVSLLYVEGPDLEESGDLRERSDAIELPILQEIFAGHPKIEGGGSKGSLKPKTWDARGKGIVACCLRDRDFDADPPADSSRPVEHARDTRTSGARALGWTWCRHEIESYLLEPRLVAAACGLAETDVTAALLTASQRLLHYTAARWTVGALRRDLLPPRELSTRPAHLKNTIQVPDDCSHAASSRWAFTLVASFRERTAAALAAPAVEALYERYAAHLAGLTRADEVLLWHSGKDLLAALDPALYRTMAQSPRLLRRRLRNWVRVHPEETVDFFPEWQALRELLRS